MNKTYFVDTNIFLRLLLKDHKSQYPLAKKIFKLAETKKIKLWTTDVVILELIWTLKSLYKYTRIVIRETIESLLALEYLTILNKNLITSAIHDFEVKNIDFADCYNHQLAIKQDVKVLSFDADFKKLVTNPIDISKFVNKI